MADHISEKNALNIQKMIKPVRKVLRVAKKSAVLPVKGLRYLKRHGMKATFDKVSLVLEKKRRIRLTKIEAYESWSQMLAHLQKPEMAKLGVKVYLPEIAAAYEGKPGKRILLGTHELMLTGGPMAVRYFAKCLKDQNGDYLPMIISPSDGRLAQILAEDGIPVIVYPALFENTQIYHIAKLFDMLVLNTIVNAPVVNALEALDVPILWWIHEAKVSYHRAAIDSLPQFVAEHVKIRTGGSYAAKMLKMHRPMYDTKNLLYCVPRQGEDAAPYQLPEKADGKMVFALVGILEERKGQNILADAIRSLPDEIREQCCFVFVGRKEFEPVNLSVEKLLEEYPEQTHYIEEVTPQELQGLYEKIDCLVCASLDDPMPIVVTQAWMHGKLVICSENTGSAALIDAENAGFVYRNNDPAVLAACIEALVRNPQEHEDKKEAGKQTYDRHFSVEAFASNAIALVDEMISEHEQRVRERGTYSPEADQAEPVNGIVSVVVPTYNAGAQWEKMLGMLRAQEGIDEIDIVAVDSGSRDDTVAVARAHGVNVLEIPQERFSHSYARNLGAEHARGDVIIFMTQDAMPSDTQWMRRMIAPIVSGEAAAVSCRERCPEGTDLYYEAASWNHIRFQGVLDEDQLNEGKPDENSDELRARASLNDVACAVKARIFKRFHYRFNYGEDLDLGLRLLRNGYRVKILASTEIVHSHNRDAGYYLKRGYVESVAMGSMYMGWRQPGEDERAVARKIICSSSMLNAAIESTRRECTASMTGKEFFDKLLGSMKRFGAHAKDAEAFEMKLGDRVLLDCLKMLENYKGEASDMDDEGLRGCMYYLEFVMMPYLAYRNIRVLDVSMQETVYACVVKQFCMMTGSMLARIDTDAQSYEKIQEMTRGV